MSEIKKLDGIGMDTSYVGEEEVDYRLTEFNIRLIVNKINDIIDYINKKEKDER